jgi:integral membrane protein
MVAPTKTRYTRYKRSRVLSTPIGRVRAVGFVEGVSFLLLLGIATPLKHLAGIPEPVLYLGWAHGVLWMAYLAVIAHALGLGHLTRRQAAYGVVASVLPFGPFVYDSWLRRPAPSAVGSDETAG